MTDCISSILYRHESQYSTSSPVGRAWSAHPARFERDSSARFPAKFPQNFRLRNTAGIAAAVAPVSREKPVVRARQLTRKRRGNGCRERALAPNSVTEIPLGRTQPPWSERELGLRLEGRQRVAASAGGFAPQRGP